MRKFRYFVPVTGVGKSDGTFLPLSFEFDGKRYPVSRDIEMDRAWSRVCRQKYPHWKVDEKTDLFWNGLNAFWIEIPLFRSDLMNIVDRSRYT